MNNLSIIGRTKPPNVSKRIRKIMRVYLLIFFSAITLSHAASGFSQEITLKMKTTSIRKVCKEIESKTDYYFVFADNAENLANKKISVDINGNNINEILDVILSSSNLNYEMFGKQVVVYEEKAKNTHSATSAAAKETQQQQQRKITGKVTDAEGEAVIGANVMEIGTTNGTVTDIDGVFVLSVRENAVLRITYIGYLSQNINVERNIADFKIVMQEDSKALDEVVITGYQDINKQRMTGTVTTIRSADIEGKGFTSIDDILIGTVSGLNATQSGRPGQDATIQIRGVNSLTGNTEPIWIVDGMPMQGEIPSIRSGATDLQTTIFTTGIGNLAPDDIASITILKDAAATAIYGARAANGVIVVTTKSGTVGKTRFNASLNYGVTAAPVNNISMMNSAQKIQFERDIYNDLNTNRTGRISELLRLRDLGIISTADVEQQITSLSQTNTDWFKEIFSPANSTQIGFSMSGGSEKTQHYLSVNHLQEEGIQPNNKFDRTGMNIKLTHDLNDKIRITGGLASTLKNDRSSASAINPLNYAMFANPYEKLYNADGSYAYDQSYDMTLSTLRPGLAWPKFNILDDLNRNTNTSRYIDADVSLKLEYEIIPGLQFITHGTYNVNSNNSRVTEGEQTYTNFIRNWFTYNGETAPQYVRGSLNEGTAYSDGYTFRNTLQYSKSFQEKHFLTLFGGQEITSRTTYNSFNYSPIYDADHRIIGFPEMGGVNPEAIKYNNLGGTGKVINKLSSFFANASYSYADRYILTGAIRYDGSDIIGNKNQFTPLWNIGGRWNVQNESFFQNVDVINELSLRAGFGYTGSIDKNAFPFVVMRLGQSVIYDGQTVPTGFTFANPNVKWQTKQDINFGANIAAFNRRIEIGVNYYHNITQDVLDMRALPLSSGRDDVIENVADILNKGIEIDLGATLIRKKDLQWFVRGNVAFNTNRLSKTYYTSLDHLPLRTPANGREFVEGYSVGSWFGYHFAGVNPANGHTMIYDKEGETFDMELLRNATLNLPAPAANHLGNQHPPIVGGFGTSVNWKQFLFSTNFEFKAGHKIRSFNTFQALNSRNRHINDIHHWRQAGDQTNVPEIGTTNNAFNRYMYDVQLEKGDYLRASIVTVGYNIKPDILKKWGFSTARISLTGRNLFTVSSYAGIDPSLMGQFNYPVTRQYTATLNIGF